MVSAWAPIRDFDNYLINREGQIIKRSNSHLVKTSQTQQGAVKVGLSADGLQYTRSLKVLVAETFVKGKTGTFDTPVHLDGDQINNVAANLVWRPRWFAIQYALQFKKHYTYLDEGPIVNCKTGEVSQTIEEVGYTYGVLVADVYRSLRMGTYVFPINVAFEYLK